jgi:hypothetical protein
MLKGIRKVDRAGRSTKEPMSTRPLRSVVVLMAMCGALVIVGAATARVPPLYKNCTNLNKKYRHGIGRAHARDRSSGVHVSTFFRSDRLYRIAMSYNRGLDRDKDGIACEKA